MRASRGMGDISPSKMPKGRTVQRKDNTDIKVYQRGGVVKPKPQPKGKK